MKKYVQNFILASVITVAISFPVEVRAQVNTWSASMQCVGELLNGNTGQFIPAYFTGAARYYSTSGSGDQTDHVNVSGTISGSPGNINLSFEGFIQGQITGSLGNQFVDIIYMGDRGFQIWESSYYAREKFGDFNCN